MNILTYKDYQGRFVFDPDADLFHGDVLYINDVITFQGRSIDELKKALAESVEDYLAFCAEKGKTPDKPYSGARRSGHLSGDASAYRIGSRPCRYESERLGNPGFD